jgi:glycerol uptake facilitator-like aquaporin
VLILIFGPLSGAHFNPAVSIAFAMRGTLGWSTAGFYIVAQVVGGLIGVWAADLMFELPIWQISTTPRVGPGQWFAEAVASFGLLLTIFGCVARTPAAVPYASGSDPKWAREIGKGRKGQRAELDNGWMRIGNSRGEITVKV